MSAVIQFTDRGLYCPAGAFFIDPWRPVDRALITHGHADHARSGMGRYLATDLAAPVLRHRLGKIALETIRYGEQRRIGDATVSFHPAGHVPGSAQIRVEVGGEVWVISGDYKTAPDRVSTPYEPVPAHSFITECTFGLPVFRWPDEDAVARDINDWWVANRDAGRFSLLGAYSLGKAQRVLSLLDPSIGPILTHGAVQATTDVLRAQGIDLPATTHVTDDLDLKTVPGAMVVAPPGALGGAWAGRFRGASTAFASGWMALRGMRRRRAGDRGFVLSDHADWAGLNEAVRATGAEKVFVTHGYTAAFSRWLSEAGFEAGVVETEFVADDLTGDLIGNGGAE